MVMGHKRESGCLFIRRLLDGSHTPNTLGGRPVRLRVVMRACKLFAFQFP